MPLERPVTLSLLAAHRSRGRARGGRGAAPGGRGAALGPGRPRRAARRALAPRGPLGRAGAGLRLHDRAERAPRAGRVLGLGRDRGRRGLDRHERPRGRERAQRAGGPPAARAAAGGSILRPRSRRLAARVVGLDRETDVAVLKVEQAGLPALEFGDSEALHQGQIVLAFGSPLGPRELGEPGRRERGRAAAEGRTTR